MATDMLAEQRLSLTELAREQGVSVPTAWRWATRGIRGTKLETLHVGARRFTTREAFSRWIAATQVGGPLAPTSRSSRQCEASIKRAEEQLAKAGI